MSLQIGMHRNNKIRFTARLFLSVLLVNMSVSILCAVGVDTYSLFSSQKNSVVKKHHGKPCKCPKTKNCCSEEIAKFNKLEKQTGEAIVIKHFSEEVALPPPVSITFENLFEDNTTPVKPVARWVIPPPHDDIRVFIQSFLI